MFLTPLELHDFFRPFVAEALCKGKEMVARILSLDIFLSLPPQPRASGNLSVTSAPFLRNVQLKGYCTGGEN